jgi:hypothetical protein
LNNDGTIAKTKPDMRYVSLFKKNGRVMSRKEFVAQAKGDKEFERKLDQEFDKIKAHNSDLGLTGFYTLNDIGKRVYNGAKSIKGIALNPENINNTFGSYHA